MAIRFSMSRALPVVLALFLVGTVAPQVASGSTCSRSVFVTPISLYGGDGAGLAVDTSGDLYIAEDVNTGWPTIPQGPAVAKVTPDGTQSMIVPNGVLGDVTALAVDASENLY